MNVVGEGWQEYSSIEKVKSGRTKEGNLVCTKCVWYFNFNFDCTQENVFEIIHVEGT